MRATHPPTIQGRVEDRLTGAITALTARRFRPEWPQGDGEWTVDALERHTRALARQVAAAAAPSTTEQQEATR